MIFSRFLIAFAALAFVVPAAGPAQPSPSPAPEALVAARELLIAIDFSEQLEATLLHSGNATITTMLDHYETSHGVELPEELESRFRRLMLEHLQDFAQSVRETALEDAAAVYARYFSADELRALRELQTHPVMEKMNRIAPVFLAELQQVGMAESARRLPELQQRIAELIQDYAREQALPES